MTDLTPLLTIYISVLSAVLGLFMGSFLCCAGVRMARGEGFVKGRSHCDACGHMLGAKDLVPLVSFLSLRGRCRYCGGKISKTAVTAELITAAVFPALFWRFSLTADFVQYTLLACVLILISFADLEAYEIPDGPLIFAAAVRLVFILLSGDIPHGLLSALIGGLSVSLPLLAIVLIADKVMKKETMGGGDIKLLFAAGLYFSWKVNLFAFLLACILGIIFALPSILNRKQDEQNRLIPFGPAIAAACFIAMLCGDGAVAWYLSLF